MNKVCEDESTKVEVKSFLQSLFVFMYKMKQTTKICSFRRDENVNKRKSHTSSQKLSILLKRDSAPLKVSV